MSKREGCEKNRACEDDNGVLGNCLEPKLSSDIVKLKWKNVMLRLVISGLGIIVFIDLVWG